MDTTLTRPDAKRLHVFYDGGCPLCSREIRHYQRLTSEAAIHWVDIQRDHATLDHFGLRQEDAMRRMHAYRPDGEWLIGVYAFLAIWLQIPRYRWAARLVRLLRLDRPLQRLYHRWAERRFARLCNDERCKLPHS
ncbi:MAG: DUF393 domain-containing protein [Algiphilus sp.]|nr:DUF393 domain-containing protein [Algiphilus sp.]